MSADTLSNVLREVRLTGAVFFDIEARDQWAVASPPSREIAPMVLPGAGHVIPYHVITEGACWLALDGQPPLRLEAGSVVAFPQGHPHVLSSAPGMRAEPNRTIYVPPERLQLPVPMRSGTPGRECTGIVCGFLACSARPFNPLIGALPPLLHVQDRLEAGGWMSSFVTVALAESRAKRAGGETVLGRLSELLFVELLRRHFENLGDDQTGWLAALRDPYVGRALARVHERPASPWTLEDLAAEAGQSRSAFAERFTRLVGQPPMQYLARWRVQVASGMLARGAKVSAVALDVGYESEAAFGRAFKKLAGVPPGRWREQSAASPGAA